VSVTRMLKGALAGCIATGPMTVAMLLMHYLLPWHESYPLPPAQITRNLTEGKGLSLDTNRPKHRWMTWVLHFGFGTIGGVLYAPLARILPGPPAGRGSAYALALWAISYLGWIPATNILPPAHKHPAARNLVMIVAHIVWGGVLGILADRFTADEDAPDSQEADDFSWEYTGAPPVHLALGEPSGEPAGSPQDGMRPGHDSGESFTRGVIGEPETLAKHE